jgi:UDP-glucose 4-epimerase
VLKKILFPSSVGVYGDNDKLPLTEESSLSPISNYAFSKFIFEKYLNYYRKDIEFIFFRLANVYGPRQISMGEGGVISTFIDNALSNRPSFIYGDGSQTRDFVYVDDVVDANILLLNSAQKNLYFNVSTNQEIEISSLHQLVYEQSDCNLPPIFKSKREGDIYRSCISYEKINRECGWQPKVDITEGLKRTIEWIKSSKNAKK